MENSENNERYKPIRTNIKVKNTEVLLEKVQKLNNLINEINVIASEIKFEIELK